MRKPTSVSLPPLRIPTDLEIWTILMGMIGLMDVTITALEEGVGAADDAEADVLEGLQ